jgi:hypothetical protein
LPTDARPVSRAPASIYSFWYKAQRDVMARLIKLQNEKLAESLAEFG